MAADWSGPYGGLGAGAGFGQQSQQGGVLMLPARGGRGMAGMSPTGSSPMSTPPVTTTPISCPSPSSNVGGSCVFGGGTADGRYRTHGGLVGGSVGYNFQRERLVYGASLDGSWADISGSGSCGVGSALPHSCGGAIRALGTGRVHLGYDVLGPALGPFGGLQVFAAGGVALAKVSAWDSLFNSSGSKTLTGWTIGGGVEVLFAAHWAVTLEYLHVDLGEHAVFTAIAPNPERVRTTAELIRIGLSYHFNSAIQTPAVIAKY